MTTIYAVATNKGGVGKTTIVSNLATILSRKKKVLVIDMDGQGNLSLAFGLNPYSFNRNMYDVMMGNCNMSEVIHKIDKNLYIAPSADDMNFLEFNVLPRADKYPNPFNLLKSALESSQSHFDYIIIDTPPSLGLVAGNVLSVAHKVVIPFVPELFSVQGTIKVVEAVQNFATENNKELQIDGIVGSQVDSRVVMHSEFLQQARAYCDKKDIHMFETIIPKAVRYSKSMAYDGAPTTKSSSLKEPFEELAKEIFG